MNGFCNPATDWGEPLCVIGSRTMEGGQLGQSSRHRLWQPMLDLPDIAAVNDWRERCCNGSLHEIPYGALPTSQAYQHAVPGNRLYKKGSVIQRRQKLLSQTV